MGTFLPFCWSWEARMDTVLPFCWSWEYKTNSETGGPGSLAQQ